MKIKLTGRNFLSHGSISVKKGDVSPEIPADVALLVLRNKWGEPADDDAKKLSEEIAKPPAKK